MQWILKRLKLKVPFDGNKLYATEILSILLQNTPENRKLLGELDGIDVLLQQLAVSWIHYLLNLLQQFTFLFVLNINKHTVLIFKGKF